jgi:hypothetical protein
MNHPTSASPWTEQKIATFQRYLKEAYGIDTLRVELPTEEADGALMLSDKVHIQVPTFGGSCNVVQEIGKTFKFFPERNDWTALISDIRSAMHFNGEAV